MELRYILALLFSMGDSYASEYGHLTFQSWNRTLFPLNFLDRELLNTAIFMKKINVAYSYEPSMT